MLTLGSRAKALVASSMLIAWGCLAYACTAEDENPASPRTRVDAGEGGTVDPTTNPDAALGAPICAEYGGYAAVQTIARAILTKVSADCRISAPFANLSPERTEHLRECFEIQMGSAFQCPGIAYVSNTTADSKGKPCRDMSTAHKGLGLRKADVDAFRDDVVAVLTEGDTKLAKEHVISIAAFIEGSRGLVTQNDTQPDKNTFCACPGGEFNGKSCVPDAGVIIDAAVDTGVDTGIDSSVVDAATDGG